MSPLVTGLSARFRDRVESRSASDFSTESKVFAPVAPCAKAAVIARANAFEPAVRSRVRVRTPSMPLESASVPRSPASFASSAIRGSPHERKFLSEYDPRTEEHERASPQRDGSRRDPPAYVAVQLGGASGNAARNAANDAESSAASRGPKPIACFQGNGARLTPAPLPPKGVRPLRRSRRAARPRCAHSRAHRHRPRGAQPPHR